MKLTNEDIGKVVDDAENFFEKAGVSQKDKIKISLILEESLLRYQDHFGSDYDFKVTKKKLLGASKMTVSLRGDPFNPLDVDDEKEDILPSKMMANFLHYEDARAAYRYEDGYNELNIFSTKEKKQIKIPGGSITIAILLAIVCAFFMGYLQPETQTFILDKVANPIESTLMRLIIAATGPFVFMAIVSGICVMSDVTTFSNIGLKIFGRFVMLMLLMEIFTAAIAEVFFPALNFGGETEFMFTTILDLFLGIVPKDLISPFIEGNVIQIVFIAIIVGVCVLILDNFLPNTKSNISELNRLLIQIMDLVSNVIPVIIFLIVFETFSKQTLSDIAKVWEIIAVNYLAMLSFSALMLLNIAVKYRVNIPDFLRKMSDVLLISFSTGSTTLSMMPNMECAKNKLKIDPKFCDFWLPLSHVIFSPTGVAAFVLCVFYAAHVSGTTLSVVEFILLLFLSLQLSIASPPVPGGLVSMYAIILGQFHLPTDAIGMLMISGIFVANASTSIAMLIRDCELIDVSHQVKL